MRRIWIPFLLLISIALIVAGFLYYRAEKDRIRREKYDEIASVAELKVRQIESWRLERLADASVLSRSPFYARAILNLVNAPANPQLRRSVQERLDLEDTVGLYSDAFILDTARQTLVSAGLPPSVMDASEKDAFNEAVLERKPVMTDLFRGVSGTVHIDAMAPILGESGKTAAVVVLRSDADKFLYPLINSWPIPSRSAETLLLEKRGDHVVFLNNLRYNPGAALSLSMPLTSTTIPAVQAALGKVGMFEGKDYRGEEVLADLRPVSNTPWFMVAKVDANEILAEAKYRGGVAMLLVVLFIAISVTATAYAYRHRQAGTYRKMYQAEHERKRAEEALQKSERQLSSIYDTVGDVIFRLAVEANGSYRFISVNQAFRNVTGLNEEMVVGKLVNEIIPEPSLSMVLAKYRQAIEENSIVRWEETSEYPNGQLTGDVSIAPVLDAGGRCTHLVGSVHDITESKRAEKALREGEQLFRGLFNASPDAIVLIDPNNPTISWPIVDCNEAACKMNGYTREELIGQSIDILNVTRGTREERITYFKNLRQEGTIHMETPHRHKDGHILLVEFSTSIVNIGGHEMVIGIDRDITKRKNAEIALRESQQMLRTVLDTVPVRVFWKDRNGVYLGCNLPCAKDSGFESPGEIIGKNDFQMGWREQAELYRADDLQVIESSIPKLAYEEPQSFDKGIRWLRTNKVPLRSAEGEIVGVLGTYEDVTDAKQAALLLAYERYLLNALLENTMDSIYFKDTEGHFTRVSASMVAKRGLTSVDQLLGKTDFDFFTKEGAQEIYEQEQEIIRTHKPLVDVETQELWTDRPPTWVSVTKVPLHDQAGEITGIVGISRDITERKLSEEKVRESEQRFRMVFENVFDGISIYIEDPDPYKRRLIECNERYAAMAGRSREELLQLGSTLGLQITLEDTANINRLESLAKGMVYQGSFSWIRPDGKDNIIEYVGMPITWRGKSHTIGIDRDITERKNAEIALRESEEKFRGLVEGSAAAIWIHDGKRFLYANPAALEMSGYTAEELYRLAPMEIVHPDHREFVMNRSGERMGGKDVPKHYEYQIMKKSGEAIWIDFSGAAIDYQGKHAIIASAYDISDRKKLEEQLVQAQKMEGIGRLAGGVAHDYNNMLGVIIGYSDLIMKKMNNAEPVYRYVELIASAAKRGADITRQLLAFARREIISPCVLDPNKAIESLEKMLQRLIGENIKLMFLPEKNIWKIKIDQTQLDQILVNLATNARDAIDDVGTITIETSNASIDEAYTQNRIDFSSGEYLVISFTDTGKGMSKETMKNIFEPFFTTKSKGQGTGLGLSTVYGIVKQNGGSINVYSEMGVGTTFKIYLPRYQGEVEEPEAIQMEKPISGSGTVLIVEDQADLLELAKNSLEEYGYKVLTALNPEEGILLCETYESEIHLLLTDVIMPTMNGKELRDTIQTIKPNIKTIFMSGYTADVIAHQGVLDEGIDFIQKPFTPYVLAKKVHEVLKA